MNICDLHGLIGDRQPENCLKCSPSEQLMTRLKNLWMQGPWADSHPWPVDGDTYRRMVREIEAFENSAIESWRHSNG